MEYANGEKENEDNYVCRKTMQSPHNEDLEEKDLDPWEDAVDNSNKEAIALNEYDEDEDQNKGVRNPTMKIDYIDACPSRAFRQVGPEKMGKERSCNHRKQRKEEEKKKLLEKE